MDKAGTSASNDPPRRVLLKLSGEAFARAGALGIEPEALLHIASEVGEASRVGVQLAVVVGGGNMIRGATLAEGGHIQRATADYMGMLGTVINALAFREELQNLGVDCRVMSALEIPAVAERFIRSRALRHLDKGRVVILAAGTGNPFFSTDTCAALRATELDCDVLLKATKVDGVYSADPATHADATRYDELSFTEAMTRNLRIMDQTALAMCREHKIPVRVFDFRQAGAIRRAVEGEQIGTLVTPDEE